MQWVHQPGYTAGFCRFFSGRLGAGGYIGDGFGGGRRLLGDTLDPSVDRVGSFEFDGVGHIANVEVHALERGQGHFLHFQGLDGRAQCAGVLLQPEVHVLEFINALFELFDVQRRSDPIAQIGHLGDVVGRAFGQALQKIKTWNKLTKTSIVCVTHMHSDGVLTTTNHDSLPQCGRSGDTLAPKPVLQHVRHHSRFAVHVMPEAKDSRLAAVQRAMFPA